MSANLPTAEEERFRSFMVRAMLAFRDHLLHYEPQQINVQLRITQAWLLGYKFTPAPKQRFVTLVVQLPKKNT